MNLTSKSKILYLSFACLALIFTFYIQNLGQIAGDVASLLYDTQLVLQGGTYVRDFFETNPPMIFYLYSPVVLLAKFMSLDLTLVFRIYVCTLIFISATCSVSLLSRIFAKEDKFVFKGFICVLFFVLLLLPGVEFGQREHFLMILFFPYVFSAVLRAQNKKIAMIFAIAIGLMAGLGIGLKPYFLFPIVFIELYLIWIKRSLFAWIRPESMVCGVVLVVYLISVFVLHQNYIHLMLPLISHLYFISITESWPTIFLRPSVIYCCVVWMCFFLVNKRYQHELIYILMLAFTGMMAAFIVPRAAWYYHVLPAFGLSCLLAWLYSSHLMDKQLKQKKLGKMDVSVLMAACCFVLMVPFIYFCANTEKAILSKKGIYTQSLTAYINSLPQPQRLYCFSANTTVDCFPLVYHTHSEFAGRFPFYWWLRGVIYFDEAAGTKPLSPVIAKDKQYFMDLAADDLNTFKPTLIIVNRYFEDLVLGKDFDYIAYLSRNEKFRQAWKHYHYLKNIGVYQLYSRG